MNNSISILLAAGFSAPMGYPIGNSLNEKLTQLNTDLIAFSSDGRLAISTNGKKPDFGCKTSYDNIFEYCIKLIGHYSETKGHFDYEEFYDYLVDEVINDEEAEKLANEHLSETDFTSLVSGLKNIYNQLVSHFLKDRNGENWYENRPYNLDSKFDGYTGFLRYLTALGENNVLNIHTLNHDLFLESLCGAGFFGGNLSDGFEEFNSPYYGNLKYENRNYRCRLESYVGEYQDNFRLYKLHGSLDYGVYYKSEGANLIPEKYIKTKYGIGFSELLKETKNSEGQYSYENCRINYHADYLTGTTSKIQRYKEPLLFKELFKLFKTNLETADKLIIVGYGAKDSEVNNIIKEHFDYNTKPSYIIDPFAGETVIKFGKEIGAKIIKKQLDVISKSDFE
jgi:hypothetical protein